LSLAKLFLTKLISSDNLLICCYLLSVLYSFTLQFIYYTASVLSLLA
jgi:hypothetical protein